MTPNTLSAQNATVKAGQMKSGSSAWNALAAGVTDDARVPKETTFYICEFCM